MLLSESLLAQLRHFLAQKLEPICDADPEVLSEYVLALLKHDLPVDQLKEKCNVQLGDFLRDHTQSFVADLFSFIGGQSSTVQDHPPNPSSTSDQRHQNLVSFTPLPEIDPDQDEEDEIQIEEQRDTTSRHRKQPREKFRCRNFDRFGSCRMGEKCKFEHIPKVEEDVSRITYAKYSLADDSTAKRVVLDRVPLENCNKQSIFYFFKRFGHILDVDVDSAHRRASILFASHEEALRAYQSPESMFGNRFVKIFWDSNQQVSEEILQRENSRLEMAKMRREQLRNKEIVAQKERLLLQQIEQQRILMQQLQAKDISEESKTELLSSLNKVTMLIQPSAAEFQPRKRQFSNEMSISPAATNPPPSKRALSLDFRPKALTIDCLPEGKTMTDISVMLQKWFPLCSSLGEEGVLLEFGERFQAEGALSQLKATFPDSTIAWKV